MLARTLPRLRGASRAPALVRRMTGSPEFPPPMGKHEDPLMPNLVLEESVTGLDAGLPKLYDRDIWANPDALVRCRLRDANLALGHAHP